MLFYKEVKEYGTEDSPLWGAFSKVKEWER